mgnify:CR=1 FL=1
MSDITLADYKIQAYLLSNAEDIIEATGRTQEPQALVATDRTVSNPQTYYIKKSPVKALQPQTWLTSTCYQMH